MLAGPRFWSPSFGHVGLIMPYAGRSLPWWAEWCRGGTVSRVTRAALFDELCPSSSVTFTVATPGVVNWTNHGFSEGDQVVFSTTGALPVGLVAGTLYSVRSPLSNSFSLSSSPASALLAFADAGAGTHTGQGYGFGLGDGVTTFGLPDMRGRCLIGAGQGSGLTSRGKAYNVGTETHAIGTTNLPPHAHDLGSHTHSIDGRYATGAPGGFVATNGLNTALGASTGAAAGNTGNGPGSSVAISNFQPSIPVHWIIQAVRL